MNSFILVIIRTRREEEHLPVRFGDSDQAYMARTGEFLPRIGTRKRGT